MTRKVLIIGLILLAAILPLATLPVALILVFSIAFIAVCTPFADAIAQPVTPFALPLFRAPPSR